MDDSKESGPEFDPYSISVGDIIKLDPSVATGGGQHQERYVVVATAGTNELGQTQFSASEILCEEPGQEDLGFPGTMVDGEWCKSIDTPWSIDKMTDALKRHLRLDGIYIRKILEIEQAKGVLKIPLNPVQ